jgi:FKBP-type peptidyl-prolyl cis-trans isomerase SlpA
MTVPITHGARVTLHYTLMLADGTVVESTRDHAPETIVIGAGDVDPGLESCLIGLVSGAQQEFVITPGAAYGDATPVIESLPRSTFADAATLEIGSIVRFESDAGEQALGTVESLSAQTVHVDFAHPLAGKTLRFDVEIVGVEAA